MEAWPAPAGAGDKEGAGGLSPVERLIDPEARLQHALDVAYRYLSRRDRTVREVRQRLEHERVEPDTIDAVVASVAEAGYLDDARYAQRFAEDRRTLDGWGTDRIERRLAALGVAPGHITAALAARDGEAELEAAVALLVRRYRGPLETPQERDRALGFLVRKGYAMELAYDAIRAHAAALEEAASRRSLGSTGR
jgi:regulatory protein